MPRRRRDDKPLPGRLMRFWWKFGLFALVAYIGYTIWLGGAYRSAEPFTAGQCLAVDAPPGPEDMAMLPDGSGVILSSQDRRKRDEPGALYLYDLSSRPGKFVKLDTPASMPFHPHGLSLYAAPDGQLFLQVINHRSAEKNTVEIFTVQQVAGNASGAAPQLRHRGSVSSDLFVSPNGIAAAGPEAFYLTNDRGSGPRWMHMAENLLQLARSTVVYHDGRGARVVAEDIAMANGIEITADGSTVLVGSTLWRMMLAFTRDPGSGMLLRSGSMPLPGGVDNIRRDGNGDLWIGLHPNAFAFIGHAMDAGKESPSMVARLHRDPRGAVQALQAFGDPGTLLSGASTAIQHDGRLLVGAVFQPRILDCQLDAGLLRELPN